MMSIGNTTLLKLKNIGGARLPAITGRRNSAFLPILIGIKG